MNQPAVGSILRAVLIAAVVAGAAVGAFHLLLSDRVVDRAIAHEEAKHTGEDHGQEVVSRRAQKIGLVAGAFTYALGMGLVFGGVYFLVGERLPGRTHRRRALLLAALGLWALYVAPFLKYAANPPGAGDPSTIYYRQVLYLAFVLFTVLGLAAAKQFGDSLHRAGLSLRRIVFATLGVYACYFIAVFVLMPGNPDHNDVPTALLREFRLFSVAGAALFWALFGLLFAEVLHRQHRPRTGAEVQA